jgi:hypothetical protein
MGPRYNELRRQYIDELRSIKPEVNKWWACLVAATVARVGTELNAAAELRHRWPVGPAAHPRILSIVRKYYLACDRLNKELRLAHPMNPEEMNTYVALHAKVTSIPDEEGDLPINPIILVGESLFTEETKDLANIVGKLTYWPIGMDEKGSYI